MLDDLAEIVLEVAAEGIDVAASATLEMAADAWEYSAEVAADLLEAFADRVPGEREPQRLGHQRRTSRQ